MNTKTFRVASISSNTNSFGLRGHIFIARDGEAWECCFNYLHEYKKGQDVVLALDGSGHPIFAGELPRRLPVCPAKVLSEVYPSRLHVQTILNKDVLDDATFTKARAEHNAQRKVEEAARALVDFKRSGNNDHELQTNLINALTALDVTRNP